MKIILPISGKNGSEKGIAPGFHNADMACIYHDASGSYEWIATKNIHSGNGGLAEELRRIGISAVISTQMPLMALGFFTESGVSVYQAANENLEENIRLFKARQLKRLTNLTAKSTVNCPGSCSACSTSCNS